MLHHLTQWHLSRCLKLQLGRWFSKQAKSRGAWILSCTQSCMLAVSQLLPRKMCCCIKALIRLCCPGQSWGQPLAPSTGYQCIQTAAFPSYAKCYFFFFFFSSCNRRWKMKCKSWERNWKLLISNFSLIICFGLWGIKTTTLSDCIKKGINSLIDNFLNNFFSFQKALYSVNL